MGLQLGRAVGIVMQTLPYIAYRAIVYGILALCTLAYFVVLLVVGRIFGGGAAVVVFILTAGGGMALGLGRLLGEYVLYLLRAGHVALITEIVCEGGLPQGVSQTAWAKDRVMHYFKEISVLSLIDQFVKGIVRTLNRTLFNVMTILPIPGLDAAAQFAGKIVDFSLTYVDEALLAYTFKTKNENVYDAAKTGIVLYAQSWKGLLKNAVALTLISYVFGLAAAVVFMIPFGGVAFLLPESWAGTKMILFLCALLLGYAAKLVLFDPVACTSTILTYLKEVESLTPDAEWEARIEGASDKFRELKDKARAKYDELTRKAAPQPETQAP